MLSSTNATSLSFSRFTTHVCVFNCYSCVVVQWENCLVCSHSFITLECNVLVSVEVFQAVVNLNCFPCSIFIALFNIVRLSAFRSRRLDDLVRVENVQCIYCACDKISHSAQCRYHYFKTPALTLDGNHYAGTFSFNKTLWIWSYMYKVSAIFLHL